MKIHLNEINQEAYILKSIKKLINGAILKIFHVAV